MTNNFLPRTLGEEGTPVTITVQTPGQPVRPRLHLVQPHLFGARAQNFRSCLESQLFDDNIDTGCLAADGSLVIVGTHDGRVFRSLDGGVHFALVAKGLPAVTAVTLG